MFDGVAKNPIYCVVAIFLALDIPYVCLHTKKITTPSISKFLLSHLHTFCESILCKFYSEREIKHCYDGKLLSCITIYIRCCFNILPFLEDFTTNRFITEFSLLALNSWLRVFNINYHHCHFKLVINKHR